MEVTHLSEEMDECKEKIKQLEHKLEESYDRELYYRGKLDAKNEELQLTYEHMDQTQSEVNELQKQLRERERNYGLVVEHRNLLEQHLHIANSNLQELQNQQQELWENQNGHISDDEWLEDNAANLPNLPADGSNDGHTDDGYETPDGGFLI